MTFPEWQPQWARLAHFRISADVDRDHLEAEWFAQLKHWHVDAVDAGVTLLIGHAKDNFLPGLGLLKDYIRQQIGRYERTPGQCATCHGTSWIEASPWKSNGLVYEGVVRCPECGIPAPQVNDRKVTKPLTPLEQHEYQAGRYSREWMPVGLEAKPWNPDAKAQHKSAMRQLFDRLRIHLFGSEDSAA